MITPEEAVLQNTFYAITRHPKYQEGITYGKPRRGHQEGTVEQHIVELESNLETVFGSGRIFSIDFWKLRILIHVHDAFKLWATRDSSIDDHNSHASLAKAFLAEFTQDEDLLAMVQWHDENFALWKQARCKGEYDQERLKSRVLAIRDIELFLIFTILDGFTASKMSLAAEEEPEKLRWFVNQVNRFRPVPLAYRVLEVFGI
jgi:hypothetical protein